MAFQLPFRETAVYSAFKEVLWIFRVMGLYFNPQKKLKTVRERVTQFIRIVVLTLLLISLFYLIIATALRLNLKALVNQTNSMGLIIVVWMTEEMINILSLFYWQYSGQFEQFSFLIEKCHEARGLRTKEGKKMILKVKLFFGIFFLIFVGVSIFTMADSLFSISEKANFTTDISTNILADKISNPFLHYLFIFVSQWSYCSWFLVIAFFMSCVICVQIEARHLNSELERELKSTKFSIRSIEALFLRHTDICLVINHLNKMFEKFIFFNLIAVVPIIIFIIYICYISFSGINTEVKIQLIIGGTIAIWQLVTLTLSPSFVYEEMHRTREILYCEKTLWVPYDSEVHEMLNSFCIKVGLSSIGISVWGFATITKAVLFSAVSIMVTYLIILIQFHNPSE